MNIWSTNTYYGPGILVIGSDNNLYKSLSKNIGLDPTTHSDVWKAESSTGSPITPSSTPSQGLPQTNRGIGAAGGFGVEIIASQVIPADRTTNPAWDAAFTLDPISATNPTTSAVDNSYMKWDPSDAIHMQIKQGGWYIQGWEFSFSAAPDGNVLFQPGDMSVGSGPGSVMIPSGAGSQAFQTYSTLVYIIEGGINVNFAPMDIHHFGSTDLTLTDCQIVFVPLFTIV